jgi:outer membrane protein
MMSGSDMRRKGTIGLTPQSGLFWAALVSVMVASPALSREAVSPWAGLEQSDIATRFLAADEARDRGDVALAEARYRALIVENEGELRIEARFRLATMLEALGRHKEAAVELRAILAEKPDAQGIRVILARVLAQAGENDAARRELRQAEEAGLPPDVLAAVRQFAAALRTSKPLGGSVSVTLVADSNVNRATRSDTIDTIIAPFQLSEDAQAQAGTGLNLAGQVFGRVRIGDGVRLLARASGQGDLYDRSQFNDVRSGGQIAWRRKLGSNALLDVNAAIGDANYALNDGLDGRIYELSLRYERSFSPRHGASLSLSGQRHAARDSGYATALGGVDALYWRQWGRATLYGSIGVQRLEADARLLLFPARRKDTHLALAFGASFPKSQVAGFSPVIRASFSRNFSSLTLYDYRRLRAELGLLRSF